jgi:hypothetical protein
MLHMPDSRFTAFAIHLLISAAIFLGLACLVYFVFLPGFLFYSEGGSTILTLIGGVDVILGPLMTLVIYNKTKASLKIDLSLIAAIQILALVYGVYALLSSRPVAVFYAKGEYYITYKSRFNGTEISENKSLHKIKTPTIAITVPEGTLSLDALTLNHTLTTGSNYFSQEILYSDYKKQIPFLKSYALSPQLAAEYAIISKDSHLANLDKNQFGFFKFSNGQVASYMVLELNTGKFIAMAN